MKKLVVFCLVLMPFTACVFGQSGPNSPENDPTTAHLTTFSNFLESVVKSPIHKRAILLERFQSTWKTPIIENDSLVHFVWFGRAESVQLCTDIDYSWKEPRDMHLIECGPNDLYIRSFILPTDSRVDYCFVVNGIRTPDPSNPISTPASDGLHSQAALIDFVPTAWNRNRENIPKGHLMELDFVPSNPLLKPRKIKVYIPATSFNRSELGSIYVNDGFDALDFGLYKNQLDNLIAAGKIKPVIAVFIPPVERQVEYLTDKQKAYSKAICEELVPRIERQFSIQPNRQNRLIMGVSNGGFLSMSTAMLYPEVFCNAAGQSSTATKHLSRLLATKTAEEKQAFRFYLDCGVFDITGSFEGKGYTFLNFNRTFVKSLQQHNINYVYAEFNDGHQWANWRERTRVILTRYFGSESSSLVKN